LLAFLSVSLLSCTEEEKKDRFISEKMVRYCKSVAETLKVDFYIQGQDGDLSCIVGQKDDVFGGLSGFKFANLDELKGAEKALKLKARIPFHKEMQECAKLCDKNVGSGSFLACKVKCLEKKGVKYEN
jgi:hypothetical protein